MFATQRFPDELSPALLDKYLANGWYRMGQGIFTTHFLSFDSEFYSAIWIRLPLSDYQFGKRLHKRIRSTVAKYRCVFQAANITAEKEYLYQLYRNDFPTTLAYSLEKALLDGASNSIYQTQELAVYDGDRLVALSYFDLGADSIASILGIYHPLYKKQSLGFFTMLMEIRYGMEHGFRYFYPGYVVPGYARFDYKLRIGAVEYLDLTTTQWQPYQLLPPEHIPIRLMLQRLQLLSGHLQKQGIAQQLCYYPLFEANLLDLWPTSFFDYPVMIRCLKTTPDAYSLILVFDPRTLQYKVLKCSLFTEFAVQLDTAQFPWTQKPHYFSALMFIEDELEATTDLDQLHQTLLQAMR